MWALVCKISLLKWLLCTLINHFEQFMLLLFIYYYTIITIIVQVKRMFQQSPSQAGTELGRGHAEKKKKGNAFIR